MRKLPPNQIERIEVIKGAAGEKLYGPQGARGVIVITTKK
jgi:TonB-dependent SusC/RagA subfamily outer membrane receptor